MSDETDARVEQAMQHNAEEFMRDGPRLTFTKEIENGARCPTSRHVLRVGLGAIGVGQMWGDATDQRAQDPLWNELPVQGCMYGCSIVDEWPVYWVTDDNHWETRDPRDKDTTYWIEGGSLHVCDGVRYYPSGGYDIPLTVVDALRQPRPW